MDPKVLAIIGLRGLALALAMAGRTAQANVLYTLADAYEAGRNVDVHLAAVAEKLKSRSITEEDWSDVADRIQADSDRLQSS